MIHTKNNMKKKPVIQNLSNMVVLEILLEPHYFILLA